MVHALSALQNIRKGKRVADENMVGGTNGGDVLVLPATGRERGSGIRVEFLRICSAFLAPFSIMFCFSQPRVNGADGVWVTGEFAQISEMNHLMINDGMRYAILM